MIRRLLIVVVIYMAPTLAPAQTQPGVFTSYDDLRTQMDPLVADLRISELMELLSDLSPEDGQNMIAAEMQLRAVLPEQLPITELMRVQEFENGYRQELLAYRDAGTGYLYARLVLHERADGTIVALWVSLNTSIDAMLQFF